MVELHAPSYRLLFQVIILAKCFSSILELNWYQQFKDNKKKCKICHRLLIHATAKLVVETDENGSIMYKLKIASVLFFIV